MTHPHEIGHLVGRLKGEKLDHPRQKIVRWLLDQGREEDVSSFNAAYAESLAGHADKSFIAKENFATYEAFGAIHQKQGGAGAPAVDDLWSEILEHPIARVIGGPSSNRGRASGAGA